MRPPDCLHTFMKSPRMDTRSNRAPASIHSTVWLCLVVFASGCGLVAPIQALGAAPSAEARGPNQAEMNISFVRPGQVAGALMKSLLIVDGIPRGQLGNARRLDVAVDGGVHEVAVGYVKHSEPRPLIAMRIVCESRGSAVVAVRFRLGRDPTLTVSGNCREAIDTIVTDTGDRYSLPPCPLQVGDVRPYAGDSPIALVHGSACSTRHSSASSTTAAVWKDLSNFEEYAKPDEIAATVDVAIAASGHRSDWWKGYAGRSLSAGKRYVYTRSRGWIDLKHVVSTASSPVSYIPGAPGLTSWFVEVAQVFVAPMSAFAREDPLSNALGARAALHHLAHSQESRGTYVARRIAAWQPLTSEQARAVLLSSDVRAECDGLKAGDLDRDAWGRCLSGVLAQKGVPSPEPLAVEEAWRVIEANAEKNPDGSAGSLARWALCQVSRTIHAGRRSKAVEETWNPSALSASAVVTSAHEACQ